MKYSKAVQGLRDVAERNSRGFQVKQFLALTGKAKYQAAKKKGR